MLAAAGTVEHEPDDDVGADRADHPDVVAEDLLLAPFLERLVDAERIAEIDRAGEVLVGAVEAMRRQQLLAAQHGERLEQLRADLVLPAVAARRGDERGAEPHAMRVIRQQAVVLVVRMCRRHHQIADGVELAEHDVERWRAAERADGKQAMLRLRLDERDSNENGG
jgi:hypothetical protein